MNKIWLFIILASVIFGIITGSSERMAQSLLSVPNDSLNLLLKIGGLIIFYSGLFQVAIDTGAIKSISKIFYKPVKIIFKNVPDNIIQYISANIVANILGLGIASTPIALKTLSELKKLNNDKNVITREMLLLTILNITCFTLFPLTVVAIRETFNASINLELVPLIALITLINTLLSITITKVFAKVKNE